MGGFIMTCGNCGSKIADDAKFCGSCGEKVNYQVGEQSSMLKTARSSPTNQIPVMWMIYFIGIIGFIFSAVKLLDPFANSDIFLPLFLISYIIILICGIMLLRRNAKSVNIGMLVLFIILWLLFPYISFIPIIIANKKH